MGHGVEMAAGKPDQLPRARMRLSGRGLPPRRFHSRGYPSDTSSKGTPSCHGGQDGRLVHSVVARRTRTPPTLSSPQRCAATRHVLHRSPQSPGYAAQLLRKRSPEHCRLDRIAERDVHGTGVDPMALSAASSARLSISQENSVESVVARCGDSRRNRSNRLGSRPLRGSLRRASRWWAYG